MSSNDEQSTGSSYDDCRRDHPIAADHRRALDDLPEFESAGALVLLPYGAERTIKVIDIQTVVMAKYGGRRQLQRDCALSVGDRGAGRDTFTGGIIPWWLAIPKDGEQPSPRSEFSMAWAIVNGGPPARRDRMSARIFKNAVLRVTTAQVMTFDNGEKRPENQQYSKVHRVLSLVGREN